MPVNRSSAVRRRPVHRLPASARTAAHGGASDFLVVEEPLEIRIGGRSFVVTMRTPGDDAALAAGLLATEGLVTSPGEIVRIEPCRAVDDDAEGNVLDVVLSGDAPFRWSRVRRHLVMNASCGLCGKERIDQVKRRVTPIVAKTRVSLEVLAALPDRLRARQKAFERTGGLHAAALFSLRGRIAGIAEDVGRHNAADKVLGGAFVRGKWPLSSSILLVSGRASFEIVQKAAAAGVPILAAVSAPSTLAVDLANETGMTLVGFLRDGRANVYSGPERIEHPG